jgi:phage gp46-like protein
MLHVAYLPDEGLVRTEASGMLDVAQVAAWSAEVKRVYAEARRYADAVRHLVVAGEAAVQTREVMEAFIAARVPMRGPGDRMAVVTGSTLAMLQARRNLPDSNEQAFASEAEALAWLLRDG